MKSMEKSKKFPKILNMYAHKNFVLHTPNIEVTEKIDGSCIGFGLIDGELVIRSKGKELDLNNPDGMFAKAVEEIKSIQHMLFAEWFYYGEYLKSPRHNVICYERTPNKHIILFDAVCRGYYQPHNVVSLAAKTFGFDVVPLFHRGSIEDIDALANSIFEKQSFLGGQIEGIVVRNFDYITPDSTPDMVKVVTDSFKEVKKTRIHTKIPNEDRVKELFAQYNTAARFQKGIIRLKEQGLYTGENKDIGLLMKTVHNDLEEECAKEIKEALYKIYRKEFLKTATDGLAEYFYKMREEK